MKNNLKAYYFILDKIIKDDAIFQGQEIFKNGNSLEILLSQNNDDLLQLKQDYAKHMDTLQQANKIALGHVNLQGDIKLELLKTPFYKVAPKDTKQQAEISTYELYKPQSLTANFTENILDSKAKFDETSQTQVRTQFELFLTELARNKECLSSQDTSKKEDIIWQETVETLALKHLSFIGITTKTDNSDRHPMSLFDHMRLTSAIYNALENYEHKEQDESKDKPFLYIQGDFFGIQKFIFTDVNNTEKNAAKILRGRSAFVSILCELTAIKIIDELKLPASARILTAAGKFHILAPNTKDNIAKLDKISNTIDEWFKKETYSIAGIGIARSKLSKDDLDGTIQVSEEKTTTNFSNTLIKLFETLAKKKYSRLNLLCSKDDTNYIHKGYIKKFTPHEPCDFMPYLPATVKNRYYLDGDNNPLQVSSLADIQINLGTDIPNSKFLVVYNKEDAMANKYLINSSNNDMDILGYQIGIIDQNDITDTNKIDRSQVVRIYDIQDEEASIGRTYGKKFLSAHTPTVDIPGIITTKRATFAQIAMKNVDDKKGIGVPNIASLKGDIDNLGNIFQDSNTPITLARTLYRSRMLELYFSYRLSHLCTGEFKNLYVVFAGGDDFFLLGCSNDLINFVNFFTKDFQQFTKNSHVHFSCGLGVFKSTHPVNYISSATEEYLEEAKKYKIPKGETKEQKQDNNRIADKNAICCYGQTVSFFQNKVPLDVQLKSKTKVSDWENLMYINADFTEKKEQDKLLSTSAMYKWIKFSEMAGNKEGDYRNAMWRSQFTYQIVRLTSPNEVKKDEENAQDYLIKTVLGYISDYKESFKIPLFTYLYNNRKYEGTLNDL